MLPSFNDDGLLPPGDYPLTFDELRRSFLVVGPPGQPNWDVGWRLTLVTFAERLIAQLWAEGVTQIFLDGSFVEDKAHPNDIDGYFVVDDVATLPEMIRRLNARDPHPFDVWTWDSAKRRPSPDSAKAQLPMWHTYRTELYPHLGQFSGILAPNGYPLKFPAAFRQTRAGGQPKGIIHIIQGRDAT